MGVHSAHWARVTPWTACVSSPQTSSRTARVTPTLCCRPAQPDSIGPTVYCLAASLRVPRRMAASKRKGANMHLEYTNTHVKFPPGEPTRTSISRALGYTVPEPFVALIQSLYEQSGKDEAKWPHLFRAITGLDLAGPDARYPNTPPELFPFAHLGVDGVHYGHVIHAPEL